MSVFKRQAVIGAALAGVFLLSACSNSSSQGNQTEGQPSASDAAQDGGVEIAAPKDVSRADLCGLLPPETATSLGLVPTGKAEKDALDPDSRKLCAWNTPDGSGRLSISAFDDRAIETYYKASSDYADFAKFNVAGHPAVRANPGSAVAEGSCAMFVATKEGQLLGSTAVLGQSAEKDPCVVTKQALEAAIPMLPAAK